MPVRAGNSAIARRQRRAACSFRSPRRRWRSEPSRFDSAAVTATADLDGDEYVINGEKIFVTAGDRCDAIVPGQRRQEQGRAASSRSSSRRAMLGLRGQRLSTSSVSALLTLRPSVSLMPRTGEPLVARINDTEAGFGGVMATFDNTHPSWPRSGFSRASLDKIREILEEAGVTIDYDRPAQHDPLPQPPSCRWKLTGTLPTS